MNTWVAFVLGVIFGPAIWFVLFLVVCAVSPGGQVKVTRTTDRR